MKIKKPSCWSLYVGHMESVQPNLITHNKVCRRAVYCMSCLRRRRRRKVVEVEVEGVFLSCWWVLEVYWMTNIGPQDSFHCRTKAIDPCFNMHNNLIYIEWKQVLLYWWINDWLLSWQEGKHLFICKYLLRSIVDRQRYEWKPFHLIGYCCVFCLCLQIVFKKRKRWGSGVCVCVQAH